MLLSLPFSTWFSLLLFTDIFQVVGYVLFFGFLFRFSIHYYHIVHSEEIAMSNMSEHLKHVGSLIWL